MGRTQRIVIPMRVLKNLIVGLVPLCQPVLSTLKTRTFHQRNDFNIVKGRKERLKPENAHLRPLKWRSFRGLKPVYYNSRSLCVSHNAERCIHKLRYRCKVSIRSLFQAISKRLQHSSGKTIGQNFMFRLSEENQTHT